METKIVSDLPNEAYHRSAEYADYISSSQLRNYLVSPAYYKQRLSEPNETTPAMELGSKVHDAMEYIHATGDFSLSEWENRFAVFSPPVNPSTGASYGATTKRYQEAYQDFLANTGGKQIASREDLNVAHAIARSIEDDMLASRFILKGNAEESMFLEDGAFKMKVRPDLYNGSQLFDYKTINGTLDESTLVRRILDSHYMTQVAAYQYVIHKVTGKWLKPYILFMQTCAPYGIQLVSLNFFCYTVADGEMVNDQTIGAREFEMLRDLHLYCTEKNEWPGPSIFVEPDDKGRRIMEPEVPVWAEKNIQNFYI